MGHSSTIAGCDSGAALTELARQSPATAVAIHRLPNVALFPTDLQAGLQSLPYEVTCVVATPAAAAEAGVARAQMGEVLVFARANLLARLPDAPESNAERLCAVLCAGLSPWLGRPGHPSWDTDESDSDAIAGGRLSASFAQASEAWQRSLADLPPGRGAGRA